MDPNNEIETLSSSSLKTENQLQTNNMRSNNDFGEEYTASQRRIYQINSTNHFHETIEILEDDDDDEKIGKSDVTSNQEENETIVFVDDELSKSLNEIEASHLSHDSFIRKSQINGELSDINFDLDFDNDFDLEDSKDGSTTSPSPPSPSLQSSEFFNINPVSKEKSRSAFIPSFYNSKNQYLNDIRSMASKQDTVDKCDVSRTKFIWIAMLISIATSIYLIVSSSSKAAVSDELSLFSSTSQGTYNNSELYAWNSQYASRGLHLTVLDALTDDWKPQFDLALSEWDNGIPDALSLTPRKVSRDLECFPKAGFIKVCNVDMGNNGYDSITETFLKNDKIVWSISKINDYYMKNENADRKQYVMCHELGRSFGFLHKDNSNSDIKTQTCMDVTEQYSSHRSPGISQFSMLANIYGIVDRVKEQSGTHPSKNEPHISYRSWAESEYEMEMANETTHTKEENQVHHSDSDKRISYVQSILYH